VLDKHWFPSIVSFFDKSFKFQFKKCGEKSISFNVYRLARIGAAGPTGRFLSTFRNNTLTAKKCKSESFRDAMLDA